MNTHHASIQAVEARTGKGMAVAIPMRRRNQLAPLQVHFDIDSIRLLVTTNQPEAVWSIGQERFGNGTESPSIPLAIGRNVIPIALTNADGTPAGVFEIKVFRGQPTPGWTKVLPRAPWPARDSAGELVFRERMWLIGGYTPAIVGDVWSSADGINWEHTGQIPSDKGVDIPVAFVFQDRMWVSNTDGVLFASPDGKDWSEVTNQAPWRGRKGAAGVVFNDKIWVMGGREKKGGGLYNDVWSSVDGVHWSCITEQAAWSKRQIDHNLLVFQDRIWLLGGGVFASAYHPFIGFNDIWNSADGKHWEQVLEHAPWCPRIWGASAVYHNRLWLLGGFRSEPVWENLGDTWFSADGRHWRQLETQPIYHHSGSNNQGIRLDGCWEPRHEMSVFAFNHRLWLAGGMVWPLVQDVWQLDASKFSFVTQPPCETYAQVAYEYSARADFNRSGQEVRYRLREAPAWLSLDPVHGVLRGTPPSPGKACVILEAYVSDGETARQTYTLSVLPLF